MWRRWLMILLFPTTALWGQKTFILQEEDDSLVKASLASDSGYTNGTRLLWRWTPVEGEWAKTLADIVCRHDDPEKCGRTVTAGLGQNMYTPENLRSRLPIVGDRPYGGWLYGTLMLDAARTKTIDHVELYLGVIGRDSHAADAQIFVHKHVTPAAPDPLGWDTQIGEWAAVLAGYQHRIDSRSGRRLSSDSAAILGCVRLRRRE